jgi:uncharacterized membrane protein YtjA (UPF0391 family)
MRDIVRTFTLVYGVVFLMAGILGFILNPTGGLLLGILAVNLIHNLIHLAAGILGVAAAFTGRSRLYCQALGVFYLLLFVLSLIPGLTQDRMLLGLVHINLADNILHLVGGATAAYFGFARQYGGQASSVT